MNTRYILSTLSRHLMMMIGVSLLMLNTAFAETTGDLPWDTPITLLTNDLTGKVATGVSVVAFLAAGASLVFGEELGGIAKKALYVVMGVSLIVFGNSFLTALGITGAII